MRAIITYVILLSNLIISQTYLGVSYNNSDPANSTDLSVMQKITFSGTDIIFMLSDNSTVNKALSIINTLTFGGINGGNPLPVELISFTAKVKGNIILLKWSTATEVNNYGFEIERTYNTADNWQKIGFVNGNGNSFSPKEYSFTDSIQWGGKLYYRLKQIDTDGKFEYSKPVSVQTGYPIKYELKQNYPNPFNPSTKIGYNLPIDGFVTLKVFDALGREVASLVNENQKTGSYEVTFDGNRFASGVYICIMNSADYSASIQMLIMK